MAWKPLGQLSDEIVKKLADELRAEPPGWQRRAYEGDGPMGDATVDVEADRHGEIALTFTSAGSIVTHVLSPAAAWAVAQALGKLSRHQGAR